MTPFALSPPIPVRRLPLGTAASLAVHALLGALLLYFSPLRPISVPPPRDIAVEIVTPAQFSALVPAPTPTPTPPVPAPVLAPTPSVTAPAVPATPPATAPRETPPRVDRDGVTRATNFYAGGILKDPANRKLAATLSTFADSERVVQLCNIEGLEQLRRARPDLDPNVIVGYAMSDPVMDGLTLSAAGGAFRSRRRWYELRFRCRVAPDYASVEDFEFKIGKTIPESEWESHNLNATDEIAGDDD